MEVLTQRVIDRAVKLQQIPAPTFQEARRAAYVEEQFRAEGLQEVSVDEVGNVYGCLAGEGGEKPLVVSAHLDTVFPLETNLSLRWEGNKIYGPGLGDNSLGVAGLFGLIWGVRQHKLSLPGDVWLVANVGEEGVGNLKGMYAVVERFGEKALAYLILEGLALGQVYNRALHVQRYRVQVETAGGHSWVDYGQPSAVHELASLINQLTALEMPDKPRTTLNVGVISGGTTINTIACKAMMEVDLRSEDSHTLDHLVERVEAVFWAADRPDVRVVAEMIGRRPAGKIHANHRLVRLAQRCLERCGVQPTLGVGSTDANIPLSRGLPAICIGLTSGGNAHTPDEFILTRPLERGLSQLLDLVQGSFSELAKH